MWSLACPRWTFLGWNYFTIKFHRYTKIRVTSFYKKILIKWISNKSLTNTRIALRHTHVAHLGYLGNIAKIFKGIGQSLEHIPLGAFRCGDAAVHFSMGGSIPELWRASLRQLKSRQASGRRPRSRTAYCGRGHRHCETYICGSSNTPVWWPWEVDFSIFLPKSLFLYYRSPWLYKTGVLVTNVRKISADWRYRKSSWNNRTGTKEMQTGWLRNHLAWHISESVNQIFSSGWLYFCRMVFHSFRYRCN